MENYISPIEEIIKEASLGKMFILVDAEDKMKEILLFQLRMQTRMLLILWQRMAEV